jgi:cofilin
VTELDLRIASLPATAIDFLREAMPCSQNDTGEAEYNYERFIDEVFT